MSARKIYLVTLAAVIGCAPASGTPGSSSQADAPRRSNVLTAEEIATLQADVPTAYDIVARLRPSWMTARGVTSLGADVDVSERALVFVDGHHPGTLEALRNIQAYQIGDIRFYNVAEAVAKFGVMGGTTGVIEVRMKSPSRR